MFLLFTGVAMVIYFVVGIRYAEVYLPDSVTSVGKFSVLLLIQLFSIGMVWVYCNQKKAFRLLLYYLGAAIILLVLMKVPFSKVYVLLAMTAFLIGYLIWEGLGSRIRDYFFIALFTLGSACFFYGADFIMQNVMEPHQRSRINVLLGLDEDLRGAGYNVHQSEIAIGSGGLEGKGFLNGTQTKLKFVPEQDTDFIFCTVGEEEGFVGSAGVLILFSRHHGNHCHHCNSFLHIHQLVDKKFGCKGTILFSIRPYSFVYFKGFEKSCSTP